MNRHIIFAAWLLLLLDTKLVAQDSTISKKDLQIRQALQMDKAGYNIFAADMKIYAGRLEAALKNPEKVPAMEVTKILAERKRYLQSNLYADQIRSLQEMEKNSPEAKRSSRLQRQQELKERLEKKGIEIMQKETKT